MSLFLLSSFSPFSFTSLNHIERNSNRHTHIHTQHTMHVISSSHTTMYCTVLYFSFLLLFSSSFLAISHILPGSFSLISAALFRFTLCSFIAHLWLFPLFFPVLYLILFCSFLAYFWLFSLFFPALFLILLCSFLALFKLFFLILLCSVLAYFWFFSLLFSTIFWLIYLLFSAIFLLIYLLFSAIFWLI